MVGWFGDRNRSTGTWETYDVPECARASRRSALNQTLAVYAMHETAGNPYAVNMGFADAYCPARSDGSETVISS